MKGKLFGVGIGPGEAELLTLKAVRLISECDILAVPLTKGEKATALDIIKDVVEITNKEKLYLSFQMLKDKEELNKVHKKNAQDVIEQLDKGKNVVFITLGDVSIFSTFSYIQKFVEEEGYDVELCPGIPSFCAVAAKTKTSLTTMKEPLLIVPTIHTGVEKYMDIDGTKVFMKAGKHIADLKRISSEKDLIAVGATNCGMPDEKIYKELPESEESEGYFTTIIVRAKE